MKQSVLVGPRQFRLTDVPARPLGDDDVLVEVRACGVCASEIEAWRDAVEAPRMLGHEVAGEVVAVGPRAGGFRVGDRVTGLFNQGFADQAVAPAEKVAPIPEGMRFEHALGEPLACAMSAAERTKVALGDRIAVVGLGFMGLLMLQLLRLKGPSQIVGIDIREDARAAARRFGADLLLHPKEIDDSLKATFALKNPAGGVFDVVVEATGTQPGLTLAGELAKAHGVLSILGYHQGGPRSVDMKLWNFKALDVVNAHERRVAYRMEGMRRGLALAAAGRLDLVSLVTHSFRLDQVGEAFAALEAKPKGFIKSVVVRG